MGRLSGSGPQVLRQRTTLQLAQMPRNVNRRDGTKATGEALGGRAPGVRINRVRPRARFGLMVMGGAPRIRIGGKPAAQQTLRSGPPAGSGDQEGRTSERTIDRNTTPSPSSCPARIGWVARGPIPLPLCRSRLGAGGGVLDEDSLTRVCAAVSAAAVCHSAMNSQFGISFEALPKSNRGGLRRRQPTPDTACGSSSRSHGQRNKRTPARRDCGKRRRAPRVTSG